MSDEKTAARVWQVDERWTGRIRLPNVEKDTPQDEEWCEILENGEWSKVRFHDYAHIYERPGLYEALFYGLMKCDSPRRVVGLLKDLRTEPDWPQEPLRVLDLGAGNGIVAEELRRAGASRVVGLDILPEARMAAARDRPGVYTDYIVDDLCQPSATTKARLNDMRPNALVSVAALGFCDIPALAYYNAASFVRPGGALAFNIKEEFLDARYTHGFSELLRRMVEERVVRLEATRRYIHRYGIAGQPLHYTAMIATKMTEIPRSMVVDP
ncbi:MAG: class I SAM-dependent methyltransferase [Gammaproteobacteria bacterium]|nr:class I SAM-dependent methyltransferase [Gammaproteobacteria bacterium]